MSKMIALVHESAAAGRGIGWNAPAVVVLSAEIKALEVAQATPSRRTSKDTRIIEQVRKHVAEGVVLVSSRTHADPIDLPRVLAEYDRVLEERDRARRAHTVVEQALEGVLAGRPATDFANLLPPAQYELAEQIERLVAAPPAPRPTGRKLREYKGVTYRDGKWWKDGHDHRYAHEVLYHWHSSIFDADHAAIYALKDDPYLQVPTLEDVVREWWKHSHNWQASDFTVNSLCEVIRAWMATSADAPDVSDA